VSNSVSNQSNDLCLSCGFCCDGTLFSHVTLQKNEKNKKLINIELELVDGSYSFVQPCQALSDEDGCQVYTNRPSMCIKFNCDLLKRVKGGQASNNDALTIIQQVKLLKTSLKKQLLQLGCPEQHLISFREQVVYIDSELSGAENVEKYKDVHDHVSNLKTYLKMNFISIE